MTITLTLVQAKDALKALTAELQSKSVQLELALARERCNGRADKVLHNVVPVLLDVHRAVMWKYDIAGDEEGFTMWAKCLGVHKGNAEFDALDRKFHKLQRRATLLRVYD